MALRSVPDRQGSSWSSSLTPRRCWAGPAFAPPWRSCRRRCCRCSPPTSPAGSRTHRHPLDDDLRDLPGAARDWSSWPPTYPPTAATSRSCQYARDGTRYGVDDDALHRNRHHRLAARASRRRVGAQRRHAGVRHRAPHHRHRPRRPPRHRRPPRPTPARCPRIHDHPRRWTIAPSIGWLIRGRSLLQAKADSGFDKTAFTIDWINEQAICPRGVTSASWTELHISGHTYLQARFAERDCRPCPDRARRTSSARGSRSVAVLPRALHEIQMRNRLDQQTEQWQRRYADPRRHRGHALAKRPSSRPTQSPLSRPGPHPRAARPDRHGLQPQPPRRLARHPLIDPPRIPLSDSLHHSGIHNHLTTKDHQQSHGTRL